MNIRWIGLAIDPIIEINIDPYPGAQILVAILPGLNCSAPPTGAAKPKGSLSGYLHL